MPSQDAFSLSKGAVFHDQYEVVRRIDSGAMGTVYEVLDRRTKRRRALKVMLARFVDNPEVIERFRREATVTADVVSEHVVETFDAGVDRETGLPFIVMELLRGEDLGKVVARGPVSAAEVVSLLIQASSAIDRMHAAGIIHRDLKPENLFITSRDDGSPRLKVLDFGIAKVVEKAATSATSTRNMGTPVYMSPEQVMGSGNVGPPADLYAVGHLAFTMLVGQPYWLEDALAFETVYPLLLKIMNGATEAASVRALRAKQVTLPPGFDAWFAKATAHAPEERFRSATASILALATALDVPRPMLASWPMEFVAAAAVEIAPTVHPAQASTDPLALAALRDSEGPVIPLVPRAPQLPKDVVVPGASEPPAFASTEPPPPQADFSSSRAAAHAANAGAAQSIDPHEGASDRNLGEASKERVARKDEATRTLSPVSTLPETKPIVAPVTSSSPHRRRLVAIGALFFLTGVIGSVVLVRGFLRGGRAPSSAVIPSTGPLPALKDPPLALSPSSSERPSTSPPSSTDPSMSSDAPAPSSPPSAVPSGSTSAAPSSTTPLGPVASSRPTAARPAPSRKVPAASTAKPVSTRPYGDPTRDL